MPVKILRDLDDLAESADVSVESAEGAESEEDLGHPDPELVSRTVVTATDWTADTILKQLQKGSIDLNPTFQRRDAWTAQRKSKFIESIILGLPIPQIVLAEAADIKGTFIVIDGKQRLLSLLQFGGLEIGSPPLRLSKLLVLPDLNGMTLADLQTRSDLRPYLTAFENQTIRTVVVRNWHAEKVLYLIFHRLNSTSVALSPQELRQALHPGKFLRFAAEYSEQSVGLQKTLNLDEPDFRMRDVELLVRYYAFKTFLTSYAGNLKDFLDKACSTLNREWRQRESEVVQQAEQFERAIDATFKIFGRDNAFRKWDGRSYEPRFNRAVFDVMVYFLSQKPVRAKALVRREQVRSAFKRLSGDNPRFRKSIETTTKSMDATSTRFALWASALSKAIGMPVTAPKLSRLARTKAHAKIKTFPKAS